MLRGEVKNRRRGTAGLAELAACQLTPEKRPFLSSYVLMSVRRSKFEYILTLGWKYNEGLLDCAIKIDEDMLCSSNKEWILNYESDSPGIFL